MINVRCRTNLDNMEKEVWPTQMVCRPEKGDRVESKSGKILIVVSITHKMLSATISIDNNENRCYLEVELNK